MLGAFMENEIFCDMESNLIITLEKDRDSGENTKIKEKVSTALKLTDNSCQIAIFSLSKRMRNCSLFLRLIGVKSRAKINTIANDKTHGVRA